MTNIAKAGSGLANVVASSGYDATCANAVKCNQPNWSKDALGNETDYTYDPTSGLVTSVTGPAAATGGVRPQTRISYSQKQAYYKNSAGTIAASGQNTYVATTTSVCQTQAGATVNGTPFTLSGAAACAGSSDETKTIVSYSPAGTANNLYPVSQTVSAGDSSVSAITSQTYDNVGNIVSAVGPLGSGQTTYNFYDADRRLTGTIAPDPDGSGTRTPTVIEYTYNADGVVTQTSVGTVPNQANTLANFSETYRQSTTVDAYDRPTRTATYGPGGVTGYAATDTIYDSMGRAYCSVQYMNLGAIPSNPTTTCAPGQTTTNGGDRVTQITYDADNRPLTRTDGVGTAAVAVTSTIAKQTSSGVVVAYNPNGTVPGRRDANGNLTFYTYDGFDHLSSTQFPDSTSENLAYYTGTDLVQKFTMRDSSAVTLNYDNLGRVHTRVSSLGNTDTIGYNLQGVVTSTSSSTTGNTVTESYDALGRVAQEVQPSGTVSYGYNLSANSSTITWPDGYVATYYGGYDGNVVSITMLPPGGTASSIASYNYDNLDRRTTANFGNGTSRAYAYDAASRLLGLQFNFPNAPAYNQLIGSVTTGDGGTNIGYNPASQITSLTRSNTAYSWANSYNVNRTYCPNTLNQFGNATGTCTPSTPTFAYDLKGNLTTSGTSSYGYDWLNRLTSAPAGGSTYALTYDPASRLVSYAGTSTTNLTYAGASLIEESTSGTVLRRYVPGPGTDEPIVWYEGPNMSNPRYLQADERGSIVAVSDSGGNVLAINTYDEFGIPGPNNLGRFGFTGQAWYPEIGLYNYKARIYSPTLGRFMQADPIGYGDGLNMYNYAHGDPVNGSDPTGKLCEDPVAEGCVVTDDSGSTFNGITGNITSSQASSGAYGTLNTSLNLSGSADSTSFGSSSYGDSGFVNYNNYGMPGPVPTLYGSYQATAVQPPYQATAVQPQNAQSQNDQCSSLVNGVHTTASLLGTGVGTLALVAAGVGATPGIVTGLTIGAGVLLAAEVGTDIYYATKGNWSPLAGTATGYALGHTPLAGNLISKFGGNASKDLLKETNKLVGGLYGGVIGSAAANGSGCSPNF